MKQILQDNSRISSSSNTSEYIPSTMMPKPLAPSQKSNFSISKTDHFDQYIRLHDIGRIEILAKSKLTLWRVQRLHCSKVSLSNDQFSY